MLSQVSLAMRRTCFASLLFAFSASPSQAAPLDLATAVDLALRNSPVLAEAKEKQREYRYQANVLRSTLFPSIVANGNAARKKDSVANNTVSSVKFGGEPYNYYDLNLRLTQPLLVWGSVSSVRQAGIDRDITTLEADMTARDLTRDVISAYYRVVLNQNLISILEEEEGVIREALQTARTRLGLGGRRIDLLQVRTRQALLRPQIEKAKNELAASAAELTKLMGEPQRTDIQLRGKIPQVSFPAVEGKLNWKELQLPELEKLRLARERVDQERSVQLGKQLPQLRFQGDYNFTNFTKSELFDPASKSWAAQLVLSVPLFSGLSSIFERKALEARDEQLAAQEREAANTLSLAQIKSRKVLESAGTSLTFAQEAADLARDSMKQASNDYRFGHIDFLQYLQVQESNFEAVTSLSQLKYDNIVALANYFAASGQPLNTLVELLATEEKKP